MSNRTILPPDQAFFPFQISPTLLSFGQELIDFLYKTFSETNRKLTLHARSGFNGIIIPFTSLSLPEGYLAKELFHNTVHLIVDRVRRVGPKNSTAERFSLDEDRNIVIIAAALKTFLQNFCELDRKGRSPGNAYEV